MVNTIQHHQLQLKLQLCFKFTEALDGFYGPAMGQQDEKDNAIIFKGLTEM